MQRSLLMKPLATSRAYQNGVAPQPSPAFANQASTQFPAFHPFDRLQGFQAKRNKALQIASIENFQYGSLPVLRADYYVLFSKTS
jgi:hypothetical protein